MVFQNYRGGPGVQHFHGVPNADFYRNPYNNDFSEGGGAFYCVSEHQSFGPNIASVANWVCQDSSKHYELFLKSYCLLRYMSIAASEKKHKSTMSL